MNFSLEDVAMTAENAVLNSAIFPYRTGQLRDNFFDFASARTDGKIYTIDLMTEPRVYYGKILQTRRNIRYKTKNHFIAHQNKHFRFIDKIIESDVVSAIELEYGIRRTK